MIRPATSFDIPRALAIYHSARQFMRRSGNTVPTIIETPDAQNSQSPGQETPFSLCDIWVECPGYQLLLIQNVQIFPGIASIQDLPLIPLAETGGRPASKVDISPQDL